MEELEQQLEPQGPLVSVLMVAHNRGAELPACLTALTNCKEKDRVQTIVLNTGSRDNTREHAEAFPDVTFLHMPKNFGSTKAFNIGIRSAKAELLFFLDPAIEIGETTLSELIELLEVTVEAAAVCPIRVSPAGEPVPQVRPLPERDALWKLWQDPDSVEASKPPTGGELVVCPYPGLSAILIKRSFLKGMNYFDEGYGDFGGDLELAYQIRHSGKKAVIATGIPVKQNGPVPVAHSPIAVADRLNAVAHFLGKRAGFVSEALFRVQASFTALGRALTFQSGGFSLLFSVLSGSKIDGSQE